MSLTIACLDKSIWRLQYCAFQYPLLRTRHKFSGNVNSIAKVSFIFKLKFYKRKAMHQFRDKQRRLISETISWKLKFVCLPTFYNYNFTSKTWFNDPEKWYKIQINFIVIHNGLIRTIRTFVPAKKVLGYNRYNSESF